MAVPKQCDGKTGNALDRCKVNTFGDAVEVLDTTNNDRQIIYHRADGKAWEKFENFRKKYDYPYYVVQVLNNAGDVVSDNQGREGNIRVLI